MLDHANIQTTMIDLHERDCIVNTDEHHVPQLPPPCFPRV